MTATQTPEKVLVVTDTRGGPTATQKISFSQPFDEPDSELHYCISFETERSEQATISNAFASHDPDLLVLSRYTSPAGLDWIARAREAEIPVIFHIDDDLLAVPTSLGESKYKSYNDPDRLKALRQNIEAADLCYVSTEELGRRLKKHGVVAPIVAGEVYCSVSPDEVGALLPSATGPVIGYMGTGGHSADLAMILPAICETMERVPSLNMELFGTIKMPPELLRFGTRVRHLPPVADYGEFRTALRSLGWWIGLAPLEDNPFNRCKADTKWVEYTLAGMAVVASDLPVYHRACAEGAGLLAQDASGWVNSILRLIHKPEERTSMIANAQQKLREHYSHLQLRQQVAAIFSEAAKLAAKDSLTKASVDS
jgi:hypothetical protein